MTAIPDEPGGLPPSARTEEVETITIGEEGLVVVVPGTVVPTDAEQGAEVLRTWLDEGDRSTTWATFTSDDPTTDGWRWAAISRATGTVVYIR